MQLTGEQKTRLVDHLKKRLAGEEAPNFVPEAVIEVAKLLNKLETHDPEQHDADG